MPVVIPSFVFFFFPYQLKLKKEARNSNHYFLGRYTFFIWNLTLPFGLVSYYTKLGKYQDACEMTLLKSMSLSEIIFVVLYM